MKFNRFLAAVAVIGTVFFASCQKEETKNEGVPDVDDVYFELTGEPEYQTVEEMADAAFGKDGANADEDGNALRQAILEAAEARQNKLAEELGANGLSMRTVSYKYIYRSKDQTGRTITLSAKVAWSQYWLFGWRNLDPDNLYLFEHYTITKDSEAPSSDGKFEMMVLGDNLLIMPDYIGYGFTKNEVHPYLNHELTAINSIDALEAGVAVWKKHGSGEMEDDWKMYVMGCSQGASNALAVHKYLETHPELSNKWRFDYSYCCAGAYDPALTMRKYYEWGKTAYIGAIPMTIKSMLVSYPEEMSRWKEDDFYSAHYLEVKDKVDELLSKKEVDATELNKKIKELLGNDEPKLTDILSKDALNKNSELAKDFFACLEKNNLTVGWTPYHMIKLYASEDDDIVPYDNTTAVKNAFGDKVSLFHSYWAGHVATCKKWYATIAFNNF